MAQDFATNKSLITGAFVQEFHRGFEIACQQKMSRLQSAVTDRGSIVGSSFTINDMGLLEMVDRDASMRFGDTVWSVPDAGTRVALMGDSDLYVPVEPLDVPKLLAQPQGEYQQLMVAAANRKKDKVIYNSLLGTIGRRTSDMSTSGTLTNVALPASQKIGATPAIVSKASLIAIKALFRANEADENNGETLYMTYNSIMLQQILADTSLTSADFMAVQMLQEGAVASKWLGFNWIPYEALNSAAGSGGNAGKTIYSAVAWTKTAAHFGTGKDINIDIGPRRDKRNTIQLSAQTSYGAGRANEKKVVQYDFLNA